jgi:hypothetical protein
MAKLKLAQSQDTRPLGDGYSWARSNGTYLTGRAYIDGADETAAQMEGKWGADRLRLLVSAELREKFDRQHYLFNQAIWHGGLEDVRRESGRMVTAWTALDHAAESAGCEKLSPEVWEVALSDGSVAAIVPDTAHAKFVNAEGRRLAVYTLEEIGRLLVAYPDIAKAKMVFPGAEVMEVRRSIEDPMGAIWDTKEKLDDPLSDVG